jgi:HSP20 family protein
MFNRELINPEQSKKIRKLTERLQTLFIMSLFRRDPFFDDFFGPNVGNSLAIRPGAHHAQHNLYETEDAVTLTVDVPGVLAKDLQVQVDDNVLRITGERKTAGSESKFIRSFAIDPETVDVENIKANLDCGVLTLTAPKQIKPAVSKTIAVTAAPSAITQTSVTSNKSE